MKPQPLVERIVHLVPVISEISFGIGQDRSLFFCLWSHLVGDKGNGAILDKGWFGGGMLDLWMKNSSRSVFFLLVLFFVNTVDTVDNAQSGSA